MLRNKLTRPKRLLKLIPLLVLVGACATGALQEKMLSMPSIEGASYVGNEACADCHEEVTSDFTGNVHGRLADFELHGWQKGCESCHGKASLHVDGSGDTAKILNPAKLDPAEAEALCVGCHTSGKLMEWTFGEHALANVTCTDCHDMHGGDTAKANLKKSDPELCFGCHQDVMAKTNFPSHHPIKEGKMGCSDCHNPHGALNTHERTNDLCLDCHSRYQGPFVFGHAPVEDDCTICHDAHGSVANNLLQQNEPFLCLQCHEGHFHMLREGFDPATGTYTTAGTSRGSIASIPAGAVVPATVDAANPHGAEGFQRSFGTKCTTCHQVVHGSDNPSQPLSGSGLTR